MRSHPMWVRGLKQINRENQKWNEKVAPYVGAWIETFACAVAGLQKSVAPYVGAWIETFAQEEWTKFQSRTLCGCVD